MNDLIVSKENIQPYNWGAKCLGWNFIDRADASVKQELMPAGTAEKLHFHQQANQFFFILKGKASFLVEGKTFFVESQQGFSIDAGNKHKIMNETGSTLEFILFSYPTTKNDRTDCE